MIPQNETLNALIVLGLIFGAPFAWHYVTLDRSEEGRIGRMVQVTVVDPDTLEVNHLPYNLRIKDADGPEKGGRAKCDKERELEAIATRQAQALFDAAEKIEFTLHGNAEQDKYGRYLGNIFFDGIDYRMVQIKAGFLKPWDYDAGDPKPDWCEAK